MRDGLDRFTRNRQTPDKKTAKSIPDGEDTTKKGERIMRKNKFMRAASGLLVAVLLTTCVISGTFAKYTTKSEGSDTARVAKWGFKEDSTLVLKDLFKTSYEDTTNGETVKSNTKVIAPGTSGSAQFGFKYVGDTAATAPEVAYTFKVDTNGSSCADSIQKNKSIVWSLDDEECTATEGKTSWQVLIDKIEALDGNVANNKYAAGNLPTAFNNSTSKDNLHTVSWKWEYSNNNDVNDTGMGNADKLDEVTLKITITAEQID